MFIQTYLFRKHFNLNVQFNSYLVQNQINSVLFAEPHITTRSSDDALQSWLETKRSMKYTVDERGIIPLSLEESNRVNFIFLCQIIWEEQGWFIVYHRFPALNNSIFYFYFFKYLLRSPCVFHSVSCPLLPSHPDSSHPLSFFHVLLTVRALSGATPPPPVPLRHLTQSRGRKKRKTHCSFISCGRGASVCSGLIICACTKMNPAEPTQQKKGLSSR